MVKVIAPDGQVLTVNDVCREATLAALGAEGWSMPKPEPAKEPTEKKTKRKGRDEDA